jgi:GAF domain-containing protein
MSLSQAEKHALYQSLVKQIAALIDPNASELSNYANVCAAIQTAFKHWWCGFYFVNGEHLTLGPFQGPVACTSIGFNKGVCGTAWAKAHSIIVPNVHEFEGHIACSSESNSEIVVPVFKQGTIVAVLDIDSIYFNTFDEVDALYLEQIVAMINV